MNKLIKFCLLSFLLLTLSELVNSSVIRSNKIEKNGAEILNEESNQLDDTAKSPKKISKRFFETKFLVFDRNKLTEGENSIQELTCMNQDEIYLCSKYSSTLANCTNLNFRKENFPSWNCELKNLDKNVLIDDFEIACEHKTINKEDYLDKTCSFIYKLKKSSDYRKNDEEPDDKEPESKPIPVWKSVIIIVLVSSYLLSCIFFMCCFPNKYCCTNCENPDDKKDDKCECFVFFGWVGLLLFYIVTAIL